MLLILLIKVTKTLKKWTTFVHKSAIQFDTYQYRKPSINQSINIVIKQIQTKRHTSNLYGHNDPQKVLHFLNKLINDIYALYLTEDSTSFQMIPNS